MRKEINVKIKKPYVTKLKNGYPLLLKEYFDDPTQLHTEGTILNLFDSNNHFIAKGYFGRQNKGYGWIVSNKRDQKIDSRLFQIKIEAAIAYRKDFFKDKTTTAFRLFNGEGDGIGGLTIDYFDGYYLITWYSQGIYSFKEEILQALKNSVAYKGIYHKRRFDNKGQYLESESDFLCGTKAPEPLIIKENSINYAIYLDDGAMVGIFLDQREVRKTIKEHYAKGKQVLNTFSYTGAFSVAAALGGAVETTSVDLAKRSLAKTKEQFSINNIDLSKQKIIVADVFENFKIAKKKGFSYDLVIVDPPSFARSKKRVFSAAKDYTKLLKEVIAITNQNGTIVASTNAANFDMKRFKSFIERAFKESNKKYKIEKSFSLPKDFRISPKFPEGNYLKVLFIRKVD